MGSFAFASGISQRLYRTTHAWVGQFRGGLTIATVLACSGFAAICGSTAATAATMGKIALPEMRKYKYDNTLATGCVAAAGTLGVMIPPSTVLIVYGILVEESIGKLFIAGVLPGILLSLAFVATVALLCFRNPELGPPGPQTTWKEKIRAAGGIVEAAILFFLAIGGLFLGWFSPTQAGAIGAGGALIIGLVRRKLNWKTFFEAGTARKGCKPAVWFYSSLPEPSFSGILWLCPRSLSFWRIGLGTCRLTAWWLSVSSFSFTLWAAFLWTPWH
jgi:tripartite ATP-independent transporter DctM subunit